MATHLLPVLIDQLAGSPPPGNWTEFGRPRQVEFLEALAATGSVRAAARAVGVGASTAYRARRADPAFGRAWNGALVAARPRAEEELTCRALDGVEEEVFYRGELIATRRRFDSRLLLAHLARLDKLTGAAAGPTACAGAEAFAGDFDASLERFAAGSDAPEADPAAPEDEQEPGQCNTRSTPPAQEDAEDGGEERVWCPFAHEHVAPDIARLNRMDAERPDWVRPPWEMEGRDPEEVECAQMAAYENGEETWFLALPPEDYATGHDYRIAEASELALDASAGGVVAAGAGLTAG